MNTSIESPILVTGAAGDIGAIGRNVVAMLLAKGHKVRALVRREDERAESLRKLGAEVVVGDLTDLQSVHRAIEGCKRIYFGMSISAAYLEATVNAAAVARHHGVEAHCQLRWPWYARCVGGAAARVGRSFARLSCCPPNRAGPQKAPWVR